MKGYKVSLEDPDAELPSHLLCVKCNLLLRKPRQTVCGHRLCSGCLHEHVRNGPQKCVVHDCPDIIPSEDQVYPDRAVEREVLRLEVVCTNKEDGCPWEGKLKDYECEVRPLKKPELAHEAGCEFNRQFCGRCGCTDLVYNKDLEQHLREGCMMRLVDCEYCKAKQIFKDMKDHHLSDCPEFPVECDQCHMDKIFTRSQLKNHQDLVSGECHVKMAPCSFAFFGCTQKVKPEETDSHLTGNLHEHLQLLFRKMEEVRQQQAEINVQHQNGEADHQCRELDSKLQALQDTLTAMEREIIRAERDQGQSQSQEVRSMMKTIVCLIGHIKYLLHQIELYGEERQKNQERMQAAENENTMLKRLLTLNDHALQLNDGPVVHMM